MKDVNHLPLSRLVVTGKRNYTTNDDIRQVILALGVLGNFMTQDVNVIQRQIEHIPWIKHATVRKQWPNELKVHLVERVPVAYWNNQHLLDGGGKIFNAPTKHIGNCIIPMLYGPKNSEQVVLSGYHTMNSVLAPANFHIKAVSMSARHSWRLMLQDNIRLELGRDDIDGRLQRFIRVYPALLQQGRKNNKHISYVDLRYDLGLAVGWAIDYIESKDSNQQQTQQTRANNND